MRHVGRVPGLDSRQGGDQASTKARPPLVGWPVSPMPGMDAQDKAALQSVSASVWSAASGEGDDASSMLDASRVSGSF
jgi:hypothetical protein